MTQVSGRLRECSATRKILMPHLLMCSRSCDGSEHHVISKLTPSRSPDHVIWPQPTLDSSSSWSVLTPKRFPDPPAEPGAWLTFLTPLI